MGFASTSAQLKARDVPEELHVYRYLLELACETTVVGVAIWN